ncbi:MAG: M14 family zinc carboxypeptidase [Armatimonadota bacterium]
MMDLRRLHFVTILLALSIAAAGPVVGDILGEILQHAPAHSRSYTRTMEVLEELDASERVTCGTIGYSHAGRAIPLVALHDPQAAPESDNRPVLFIIARQHGGECSGTEAVLTLAEYIAHTDNPDVAAILRQLTIVAVPAANPDGMAASRRANGAGKDLNRDWVSVSQPETRAIVEAVNRWRPDAIIDMHELPASSKKASYAQNFVETVGMSGAGDNIGLQCRRVTQDLSHWMSTYGINSNFYYDHPGDSLKLCHRYFGLGRGIPAYLQEAKTGTAYPLDHRIAFHVLGALVVGNDLIHSYYHQPAPPEIEVVQRPAEPETPAPAEPEPPRLEITQPRHGTVISESMVVAADVAGVEDGAYVTFTIDGKLRAMTTSPPYTCSIDTQRFPGGEHIVEVTLCSRNGQSLLRRACTVTFDKEPMVAR